MKMISVSLLSAYDYCPRKLFLEKVLKIVSVPRDVVIKGSIRHEISDRLSKSEEAFVKNIKKPLSSSQLLDNYKKHRMNIVRASIIKNKNKLSEVRLSLSEFFRELWPNVASDAADRANSLYNFIKQNNVFGDDLWHELSPKVETEYYVRSEELMLKGVVDRLEIFDNKLVKEVVAYELKNGNPPREGVWPGHKLQAAAYTMLLEKNRLFVRDCYVKYLGSGESRLVAMNPFLEKNVLEVRDRVLHLFKSAELPQIADNANKCRSCPLKEQCHNEKFIQERMAQI